MTYDVLTGPLANRGNATFAEGTLNGESSMSVLPWQIC
jgi:hypothetical protein